MKKYLLGLIFIFPFVCNAQQYSVRSIPYNPYPFDSGTRILTLMDDYWSAKLPIGFNFNFFGNIKQFLVAGTNSILSFDTILANSMCHWQLTTYGPLPTSAIYGNSIMFPYQDLDFTHISEMRYKVYGSTPNRKFALSIDTVPYFNAPLNRRFTGQVILLEGSDNIEMHIHQKDTCTCWNGGLAIMGIQNSARTDAYTVPGRNNTIWTAHDEAWLFSPTVATSVKEMKEIKTMLFPNPSNNLVEVILSEPSEISVSDLSGKIITVKNTTETKSILDISGWANGIYFVTINSQKATKTFSLIKN